MEACQPVFQRQFPDKAGNGLALDVVGLVAQAVMAAEQARGHGLHALTVLILDGTFGETGVPLLYQALQYEAGRGQYLVLPTAFEGGGRVERQRVRGGGRGGAQEQRFGRGDLVARAARGAQFDPLPLEAVDCLRFQKRRERFPRFLAQERHRPEDTAIAGAEVLADGRRAVLMDLLRVSLRAALQEGGVEVVAPFGAAGDDAVGRQFDAAAHDHNKFSLLKVL